MGAVTLLIVGAGGHGRDIAATARSLGIQYRLVDDHPDLWMPVPETWAGEWTIGIGDPQVRVAMADRFPGPAAVLVDPSSIVGEDCGISEGAVVGPGCVFVAECTIGRHAHITYGVKATRAVIGDYCTVGPGVTFSGYVQVGAGAYVGAHSVVMNKVRIGEGAVIGCGSVVVKDVPAGMTVKGNPAR